MLHFNNFITSAKLVLNEEKYNYLMITVPVVLIFHHDEFLHPSLLHYLPI